MRAAVAWLSPVNITTRTPASWSAATAAAAVGRGASAIAMRPATCPSIATHTTVRPPAANSSRRRARSPSSTPTRFMSLTLPTDTRWPSTDAIAPSPGTLSNSTALSFSADAASARRTMASASGCSDSRSTCGYEAQQRRLVEPVEDDVGHLGLALGERPGLVHDDDIDPGCGLECGGVLEQHAARRAPVRADHDRRRVASPSASGHVMTITVMANSSASVAARSLRNIHAANVAAPPTSATSTSQNAAGRPSVGRAPSSSAPPAQA